MSVLDDILDMAEAAEIAGRAPVSMRRAASIGTLEAKRIGNSYATTREAVSAYIARISAREWESVPQRRRDSAARRRRSARRRTRGDPAP